MLGLPLVTPLRAGAVPSGLHVPAAVLVLVPSWSDSLRSDVFSVLSPRFLRANIGPCATVRQAKVLSSSDMTCCLYPCESTSEEHKLTIAKGGLLARS